MLTILRHHNTLHCICANANVKELINFCKSKNRFCAFSILVQLFGSMGSSPPYIPQETYLVVPHLALPLRGIMAEQKKEEEGEGTTTSPSTAAAWLQALCCAGIAQSTSGKSKETAEAESDARKAKYKLRYFDIRGLGEPIRMIFHFAGVPFEDERIKQADWPEIRETTRFGKLPELSINGQTYSQSMAIGRYLGRKFGLDGKTDWERAKLDEAGDLLKDLMADLSSYIGTALGMREGQKAVLRKEVYLPTVKRYLPIFEQKLAQSGSDFLLPHGPSWTDFFLEEYLTTVQGIEKNVLKKYPKLASFMRHVRELPQLKAYIEARPESAL